MTYLADGKRFRDTFGWDVLWLSELPLLKLPFYIPLAFIFCFVWVLRPISLLHMFFIFHPISLRSLTANCCTISFLFSLSLILPRRLFYFIRLRAYWRAKNLFFSPWQCKCHQALSQTYIWLAVFRVRLRWKQTENCFLFSTQENLPRVCVGRLSAC